MSDTIHRVNHEIRQRRLQVLRVTELTPRMRRITLGGAELQGFTSMGSDDHIKLLFAETPEQQQAIEARNLGKDGGARPTMREYTPRRIDLVVPDIFDAYLLIGDETAIPAIGRRLEELPAGRQVLAVIQIEDEHERQPLPSKAQVEVIWARRQGEDLLELVRNLSLPQGQLYAWVALEKALTRQAKALLLEKGVPEDALKAAAYWRANGTADDE